MDKCVTLITEIMVNEKIKENFAWLMCVEMRGYENVRVKSARTMSFSSSLHVGWVWWPWALGRVTIPSVCWVCSQHCAEFSHGAGDVRENLFVARNYRWIYLDFLLGVVVSSWLLRQGIGSRPLMSEFSILSLLCSWKWGVSWVLHLPAEGQHLL